jgi:hypothetical protein
MTIEGACYACGKESQLLCPKCGEYFCKEHVSIFNKLLCMRCGPNTLGLEANERLTDVDGVSHEGTQFKLIGEGWPDLLQRIDSLTDLELEKKIDFYKGQLKEAIRLRDTLMVTVSALENTKFKKTAERLRREGKTPPGLRFSSTSSKISPATTESAEDKAIKGLMKSLNVSEDVARALYVKLRKIK